MATLKIPDSVLDKIRCRCGQYLSKIPINIQDGESICRECTDEQAPTPLAVARNTAYEALATIFAFPCQYKSQGCPKYIAFNKVAEHEADCSYRIYECPASLHLSCNWKGTVAHLADHYKERHPELYLELPNFLIGTNEDFEIYRLFKTDEVLLLLQSKSVVETKKLYFKLVCFKSAASASLIKYRITLKNETNGKERIMLLEDASPSSVADGFQMVSEKCINVGVPTIIDYFNQPEFVESQWTITLSDDLKKNIEIQRKLEERELYEAKNECIKCTVCKIYAVPPIYRCNHGHVICIDCKGYYNQCKVCQKQDILFVLAADLEEVSCSEAHYCRWLNCQQKLQYTNIRDHEQSCPERIYDCPKCTLWSGTIVHLLQHFQNSHTETSLLTSATIPFNVNECMSAYVIAHREVFKLIIDTKDEENAKTAQIKINVWYLGFPSLVNWWQYKVTEKDSENEMGSFIKSLNNQNCSITPKIPATTSETTRAIPINPPIFSTAQSNSGNMFNPAFYSASAQNVQNNTATNDPFFGFGSGRAGNLNMPQPAMFGSLTRNTQNSSVQNPNSNTPPIFGAVTRNTQNNPVQSPKRDKSVRNCRCPLRRAQSSGLHQFTLTISKVNV